MLGEEGEFRRGGVGVEVREATGSSARFWMTHTGPDFG